MDTFVLARRKKTKRKATHRVVIKKVNTRVGNGNLLVPRSFQSRVARKKRMTNDEIPLVIF